VTSQEDITFKNLTGKNFVVQYFLNFRRSIGLELPSKNSLAETEMINRSLRTKIYPPSCEPAMWDCRVEFSGQNATKQCNLLCGIFAF
jgi:hypothetical protein